MEQIQILTDEENKRRAISQQNYRKRVQKTNSSTKAHIQKKKQYKYMMLDQAQIEFNKLKKAIGTDFKKVESVANSIKQIERMSGIGTGTLSAQPSSTSKEY